MKRSLTEGTDLVELSAVEQARLVRDHEVSAVELLDAHLDRVDRWNGEVNAIVSIDRELAHEQARDADAAPDERRGALHGLPIAVKDMANATGFVTSYGHRNFTGNVADHDDLHVSRIRRAGAVVYGKTNIPEVAAGSHSANSVFGTTRNPHDLSRSAGGSSGGAAAALAARFAPIADGSDMGGSLRNPASFCGVVGFRTTPGVVPNADLANSFDPLVTNGPMGRDVRDTALLLSVMNGGTPAVPCTPELDRAALLDLRPRDLEGLRVAYAPDLGGRVPVEPAVRAVLDDLARRLEGAGARVELDCPDLSGGDEAFRTLRAAEFRRLWGGLLDEQPDSFLDFVAGNIREGDATTGPGVMAAYAEVTRLTRAAARYFDDVDLVIAPVAQVLPFDASLDWAHEVAGVPMGDYLEWMRAAWLFTPLGVPALSLPAGFAPGGLPVGAQLLGRAKSDVELLGAALAIEELLDLPARDPLADLETVAEAV